MRRDFTVRTVANDLYVLTSSSEDDDSPCVIPTVHFGPKLMPVGTRVRIIFDGPLDPEVTRANGRHFGYPECCIEDCVTRPGPPSEEQKAASQKTGFMPCPDCARVVLAGKPLHELILPSRRAQGHFRYPLSGSAVAIASDDPNPGC